MRYLFTLLLLLITACQNDLTPPTSDMAPADPVEAWAYNPLYPNAPICASNVNGAFLVRLHSHYAHVPTSVTWFPDTPANERRLQVEAYSYYTSGGSICRNMHGLVIWDIINAPSANWVTEESPFYTHSRIEEFQHIFGSGNGSDKVIAQMGPKQTCCPTQAGSGVAADTVTTIWQGF